jgi:hypothetical protein
MRVVFKHQLAVRGPTEFIVPQGSQVLSAQNQRDSVVVWIEQKDEDLVEGSSATFVFQCLMTGEPVGDGLVGWKFLDTVQIGDVVLHVYYFKHD